MIEDFEMEQLGLWDLGQETVPGLLGVLPRRGILVLETEQVGEHEVRHGLRRVDTQACVYTLDGAGEKSDTGEHEGQHKPQACRGGIVRRGGR